MADFNSKYTGEEVEELLDKAIILNVEAVDTDGELGDVIVPDGQAPTVNLENYYTKQEIDGKGYVSSSQLSTVATSGSYNDLSNKPTIPSAVTESTVSGWGFTKNIGTITGISANGTSISTSGVANIPAASTSAYGVTKLSSATNSTSTSLAATASAVKSAYDLANGKQDKLVSGTNIKTINGTSILGSGNITISGGGSADLSNYYTKDEIDDILGDINTILESIIGKIIITFTVGGVEYQAEEGMTWEEWVDSEYNTDGYYITEDRMIRLSQYQTVVVDINNVVKSSDIILNISYIFSNIGGEDDFN